MTITARVELSQTTIDEATGTVLLQFKKILEDDGVPIGEPQYHRTSIEPGVDVNAHMAVVASHLQTMKAGRLEARDLDRVKAHCQREHTPSRVVAFMDRNIDMMNADNTPAARQRMNDMVKARNEFARANNLATR